MRCSNTSWGLFVSVAALWLLATAGHADSPQWTLLAYLRSAGGLAEAAEGYLQQFDNQAIGPQVQVLTQIESPDRPGQARRLVFQSGPIQGTATTCGDMDSPAALGDFLRWGREHASGEHLLLLVLAHGPWPAEESPRPGTVQLGNLAQALAQADTLPEAIFLDSCYSGTLESLDHLQGRARYLVAAPGLLYSPGLPWGRILTALARKPEMSVRDLCQLVVEQTCDFWSARPATPAGLVALDLNQAPALLQATRQLALTGLPMMNQTLADLTGARGQAPTWGPHDELVEAGTLADTLAGLTANHALAAAARRTGRAARATTLAAWSQQIGNDSRSLSGPGVFFPLRTVGWPAAYRQSEPAGFAAVWGSFVQAYLHEMTAKVALAGQDQPAC
ncbi:MAG: hypothetical protein GX100_11625 [candidate division WS1 bacterium]|nr:hypothetical protein [candidate division WS1 bacterium]